MQGINSDFGSTLVLAPVIAGLVLGGPLTLYALIKLLSAVFGTPRAKFVKIAGEHKLGILVDWDPDSYDWDICRVRVDGTEMVRGGRSVSFSYTFEDSAAKKKSFVIPLKISAEDQALFTDPGLPTESRSVARTHFFIEIESTQGETSRVKVSKKDLLEILAGPEFSAGKDVDLLPAQDPDSWSVLTRVFPWRKVVASAAAVDTPNKAENKKADAPKTAAVVDFLVTKVWIEPGCIVCDACENEAPLVFQVLPDTCIVRENAPLTDGGSIQAAADGCPVNVIKFTKVPKSAAG